MPVDYTVIFSTAQWFGDRDVSNEPGLDQTATYVGLEKTYLFELPGVKSNEPAILPLSTILAPRHGCGDWSRRG